MLSEKNEIISFPGHKLSKKIFVKKY